MVKGTQIARDSRRRRTTVATFIGSRDHGYKVQVELQGRRVRDCEINKKVHLMVVNLKITLSYIFIILQVATDDLYSPSLVIFFLLSKLVSVTTPTSFLSFIFFSTFTFS